MQVQLWCKLDKIPKGQNKARKAASEAWLKAFCWVFTKLGTGDGDVELITFPNLRKGSKHEWTEKVKGEELEVLVKEGQCRKLFRIWFFFLYRVKWHHAVHITHLNKIAYQKKQEDASKDCIT